MTANKEFFKDCPIFKWRNLVETKSILFRAMLDWSQTPSVHHEISNNVVCATSKASDQPVHMQSDQSLCLSLKYSTTVKLLTEHHLELRRLHRFV